MTDRSALALLDPFSKRAEGAKVLDGYSFPSETTTFRKKFVINSSKVDGTNKTGFDMSVRPSLSSLFLFPATMNTDLPAVGTTTANSTVGTLGRLSGEPRISGSPVAAADVSKYQFRSQGVVGEDNTLGWKQYRIVGGGVRVSSLVLSDQTTGFLNLGATPITELDPTTVAFSNSGWYGAEGAAAIPDMYGLPLVQRGDNKDMSLVLNEQMAVNPAGATYQSLKFRNNGLEIAFRPLDPRAFEWKSMKGSIVNEADTVAANAVSSVNEQTQVTALNGTVQNVPVNTGFYDSRGWTQYHIQGRSMAPATTEPALCLVEYVLHVEYVKNGVDGMMSGTWAPVGPVGFVDKLVVSCAKQPLYRSIYQNTKLVKRKR